MDLTEQQLRIVQAIEDFGQPCKVIMPRGTGKTTIVAFLSKRHDMPILVPYNKTFIDIYKEHGVDKKNIFTPTMPFVPSSKCIIDEIDMITNDITHVNNVLVAFTSTYNDMDFMKFTKETCKYLSQERHFLGEGFIILPLNQQDPKYKLKNKILSYQETIERQINMIDGVMESYEAYKHFKEKEFDRLMEKYNISKKRKKFKVFRNIFTGNIRIPKQ